MYEQFYNLRMRPFELKTHLDFVVSLPPHRAAIEYLRVTVEGRAPFLVLTGESGVGKTTVLHAALDRLRQWRAVAWPAEPPGAPRDLLEAMLRDFGRTPYRGADRSR